MEIRHLGGNSYFGFRYLALVETIHSKTTSGRDNTNTINQLITECWIGRRTSKEKCSIKEALKGSYHLLFPINVKLIGK